MIITRTHPFTGEEVTRDLPISDEQYRSWERGTLMQHAMPGLSAADREWIMTGLTDQDFDAMEVEED
jgi:hypothetical protein